MMSKILIFSDGGARGNPGPAAYGFVIKAESLKFKVQSSKFIGTATNNQAEYQGILAALKCLISKIKNQKSKIDQIVCYLDSQLIVEQMKGNYKIKNNGLKPLYWEIRQLIVDLGGKVHFEHITRDKNTKADKLVNEAIDKALANSNFKL